MSKADAMNIKLINKKSSSCVWKKLLEVIKFKKPIVNVLNLDGVIGSVNLKQGLNIASLNKYIDQAFATKNVKAVVININSPGGSPVQSELIAKRLVQLSRKKKIPLICFVEDIAASGGYWIACAAPEIIVAENSLLGSLGVIFSGFGLVKAIENLGIERRVHTSGDNKALLDPFLPERKQDVEIMKRVQQDIYQNFKAHVHNSRKDKLKIEDKELFSGAIWSGKQAVEIGLADDIGSLYEVLEERFGPEVDIRIINQERSWLKRKLSILGDSIAASNILENLVYKKFDFK